MKIPSNTIEVKYTSGNEFIVKSTYRFYQGYYYELNNAFFVGKEFSANAVELTKVNNEDINLTLVNSKTYTYGFLKINPFKKSIPFTSLPKQNLQANPEQIETYYAQKINVVPTTIKEINKETFIKLQQDPYYKTTSLKIDRSDIDQAEKQIPGLKAWLEG